MSVYSIVSITVKDWDTYQEYMRQVPAVIAQYGGKYIVRGGEIISDTTSWHPKRLVILEFPTLEQLNAFRNSDEYKPVAAIRKQAAETEGFVVFGYGT
jgi:uncharacterized protein (DUF1330 family)